MVLLHGGSPKGAERIAACWADARKVAQVAFRPDFTRHKNAAPFKRNDQLLDVLPIGVVVFPGSGISDNLADKAKKLGIPLFDFRKGTHQLGCADQPQTQPAGAAHKRRAALSVPYCYGCGDTTSCRRPRRPAHVETARDEASCGVCSRLGPECAPEKKKRPAVASNRCRFRTICGGAA